MMWKELVRIPVEYEMADHTWRKLWFRIDYRRIGGELEHSFQIGMSEPDGEWKPRRHFTMKEFYVVNKGTKLSHIVLQQLEQQGDAGSPAKARRHVEMLLEESRKEKERIEERQRAVEALIGGSGDGFLGFLAAMMAERMGEAVSDADENENRPFIDGEADPVRSSPPPALPPPTRPAPPKSKPQRPNFLGTLGDRAVLRPARKSS